MKLSKCAHSSLCGATSASNLVLCPSPGNSIPGAQGKKGEGSLGSDAWLSCKDRILFAAEEHTAG